MFLLVPAYPGCPGSKAVKRSLLLLLLCGQYAVSCRVASLPLELFVACADEVRPHRRVSQADVLVDGRTLDRPDQVTVGTAVRVIAEMGHHVMTHHSHLGNNSEALVDRRQQTPPSPGPVLLPGESDLNRSQYGQRYG